MYEKKPLYRKVNTRARGMWHHKGGDYKWSRNTKHKKSWLSNREAMAKNVQRGLDYTPLFRFLLSKVGEDWDAVHSEAVSRLDKEEPIWQMVAKTEDDKRPRFGIAESTYFSGLYIDEDNRLALVDPELRLEDMEPDCPCCTHTFNGEPFVKKFADWWDKPPGDEKP